MNEMIQALEQRRLLTITLGGDSTLEVVGTSGNNEVTFEYGLSGFDPVVIVTMDNEEEEFDVDDIGKIVIRTLGGDDTVLGAEGNDFFDDASLPARAIIRTGAGADTVDLKTSEPVPAVVLGGGGPDVISAWGALSGGSGNDRITGHSETDAIEGGKGDDTLKGLGDKDYILGGPGDDNINGGAGGDSMAGSAGADTINGAGKRDQIWGMDDNDVLNGGGGNDVIWGGEGTDQIDGGAGTNELHDDEDPDIEEDIAEIEATIDQLTEAFENA